MPVYRKGPPLPLNTYLFQGKMCHVGTVQPECAKLKQVLVMLFLFQMPSLAILEMPQCCNGSLSANNCNITISKL